VLQERSQLRGVSSDKDSGEAGCTRLTPSSHLALLSEQYGSSCNPNSVMLGVGELHRTGLGWRTAPCFGELVIGDACDVDELGGVPACSLFDDDDVSKSTTLFNNTFTVLVFLVESTPTPTAGDSTLSMPHHRHTLRPPGAFGTTTSAAPFVARTKKRNGTNARADAGNNFDWQGRI